MFELIDDVSIYFPITIAKSVLLPIDMFLQKSGTTPPTPLKCISLMFVEIYMHMCLCVLCITIRSLSNISTETRSMETKLSTGNPLLPISKTGCKNIISCHSKLVSQLQFYFSSNLIIAYPILSS